MLRAQNAVTFPGCFRRISQANAPCVMRPRAPKHRHRKERDILAMEEKVLRHYRYGAVRYGGTNDRPLHYIEMATFNRARTLVMRYE